MESIIHVDGKDIYRMKIGQQLNTYVDNSRYLHNLFTII